MNEETIDSMRETLITTYSPIKKQKSFFQSMKYKIRKIVLCSHPNKAHKVTPFDFPLSPPSYSTLDPERKSEKRPEFPLPFTSNRDYYDSLRSREQQRFYRYSVQESYTARSRLISTDHLRTSLIKQRRTRPYSCSDLLDKRVTFEDDDVLNHNNTFPNMANFDDIDLSNDEMFYKPPAYLSPSHEIPGYYESLKRRERRLKASSDEQLWRSCQSPDIYDENNNSLDSTETCFALHGSPRNHGQTLSNEEQEIHGQTHNREHRLSLPYFTVFNYDGSIIYERNEEESENESNTSQSQFNLHPNYMSDKSTSLYETSDDENEPIFLPGLESIASSTFSLHDIDTIFEDPIGETTISNQELSDSTSVFSSTDNGENTSWEGYNEQEGIYNTSLSHNMNSNSTPSGKMTNQRYSYPVIESQIGETRISDQELNYSTSLFSSEEETEIISKEEGGTIEQVTPTVSSGASKSYKPEEINEEGRRSYEKCCRSFTNDLSTQREMPKSSEKENEAKKHLDSTSFTTAIHSHVNLKNSVVEEPIEEIRVSVQEFCLPSATLSQLEESENIYEMESEKEVTVEEISVKQHAGNTYFFPIISSAPRSPSKLVHPCSNDLFMASKMVQEPSVDEEKVDSIWIPLSADEDSKMANDEMWDHLDEIDHEDVYVTDWNTKEIQPIRYPPSYSRNDYDNNFQFVLHDFQSIFCGMKVVTDKNVLLKNKGYGTPEITHNNKSNKQRRVSSFDYISLLMTVTDTERSKKAPRKESPHIYETCCIYDVSKTEKGFCTSLYLQLVNGRLPPYNNGALSVPKNIVKIKVQYKQ